VRGAADSFDKTARVWNADGSGQPVVLTGHESAVGAGAPGGHGAFNAAGTHVVTCSDDRTIRIWPLNDHGDAIEPVILRAEPLDEMWSCAFSPDGRTVVSTSHTGHTAMIWRNIEPITSPDDPVLWQATNYCLPIERRIELLGVSENRARANYRRCQERVAAARTVPQDR